MIPRTLVPEGARLPEGPVATTRRRPTALDERTLVPSTLPLVALDGRSTIPANLPLEAIATRMVVPRDLNVEAVQQPEESHLPAQPTELDERITIPPGVAPPESLPEHLDVSEDLVQPDIIQTGELSFLPPKRKERASTGEMIVLSASLMLNLMFLLAISYVVSYHGRSREVDEIGRKQMEVLLPPGALAALKPSAPPAPHRTVTVDPNTVRRIAPPVEAPPPPAPQPEVPKKELPSMPAPKPSTLPPVPTPGAKGDLPKTPLKLDTPDMPVPQSGLILPKQSLSPGGTIRDAERSIGRMNSPAPVGGGGQLPGSGRGGGGGGRGTAGGAVQMLTPDEGIDFNDYLHRVYITVKQNWFAVMPASVELGDQGKVSLVFKIYQNGNVPDGDPQRVFGSGKEPLDRAAISSIRASNPFPPLPQGFRGPFIELRFTYCYNEPTCP